MLWAKCVGMSAVAVAVAAAESGELVVCARGVCAWGVCVGCVRMRSAPCVARTRPDGQHGHRVVETTRRRTEVEAEALRRAPATIAESAAASAASAAASASSAPSEQPHRV